MAEDEQRATGPDPGTRRVCIVEASGTLDGSTALFMVEALTDDALVQMAPAITGRPLRAHTPWHEPHATPARADI